MGDCDGVPVCQTLIRTWTRNGYQKRSAKIDKAHGGIHFFQLKVCHPERKPFGLRYEGPIHRPPSEADSLLIQATVGCPHNKFTFCMIYKKGPSFRIRPVKAICKDIDAARDAFGECLRTLFFPSGNTIAMPTGDLTAICRYSRQVFPAI